MNLAPMYQSNVSNSISSALWRLYNVPVFRILWDITVVTTGNVAVVVLQVKHMPRHIKLVIVIIESGEEVFIKSKHTVFDCIRCHVCHGNVLNCQSCNNMSCFSEDPILGHATPNPMGNTKPPANLGLFIPHIHLFLIPIPHLITEVKVLTTQRCREFVH